MNQVLVLSVVLNSTDLWSMVLSNSQCFNGLNRRDEKALFISEWGLSSSTWPWSIQNNYFDAADSISDSPGRIMKLATTTQRFIYVLLHLKGGIVMVKAPPPSEESHYLTFLIILPPFFLVLVNELRLQNESSHNILTKVDLASY